jgi:hypothetical protein
MTKMAKVLDTTVDFLMNGTADDIVQDAGLEKELISRFKEVQNLSSEEKKNHTFVDGCFYSKNKNSIYFKINIL